MDKAELIKLEQYTRKLEGKVSSLLGALDNIREIGKIGARDNALSQPACSSVVIVSTMALKTYS